MSAMKYTTKRLSKLATPSFQRKWITPVWQWLLSVTMSAGLNRLS